MVRIGAVKKWTEAMQPLAKMTTVEEFWAVYNHTMRPSDMGPLAGYASTSLFCFRDGIKPAWEEPANAYGCKLTLRLDRELAPEAWERLLLGLVGGSFPVPGSPGDVIVPAGSSPGDEGKGPLVVGVAMSATKSDHSVAVWLRSVRDTAAIVSVRDAMCELLRIPAFVDIECKVHDRRLVETPTLPRRPGAEEAEREAGILPESHGGHHNRHGSANGSVSSDKRDARSQRRGASHASGDASRDRKHGGAAVGVAMGPSSSSGPGIASGPRRSEGARGGSRSDDRWAVLRSDGPRRQPAFASVETRGGSKDTGRNCWRDQPRRPVRMGSGDARSAPAHHLPSPAMAGAADEDGRSALLGALVGAASLGIGVVYPVFASYRALHVGDAQERRRWLAVWLCLTAVGAADSSVGLLLSHSSLYAEAKLLLLLWLILPQTNGADVVYTSLLKPVLERHAPTIAAAVAKAEAAMASASATAAGALGDAAAARSADALAAASGMLSGLARQRQLPSRPAAAGTDAAQAADE
ncbi:hypothetical protein FNF27_01405 [Cafeteria roenbergensis]|uniref:Uncharacterized protein n=1 Tax=Cafeteria roenbergensis TaxID=33653 RepID=A0A5A8EGQ6_CAFRO|nr:hypothetical protein FNF31_06662 [Cafeteria roenbergensis]KAA0172181.1 hypothetical protein FNF28_00184 [Cafeteria roenbergensis]KAA0177075.1 hypothetical protein FNF27_01405 [Cafeteria roenbergensis]